MIPQRSTSPQRAEWLEPVGRRTSPLEALALGGESIGVSESGDYTVPWKFVYSDGSVSCSTGGASTVLFNRAGVTHISACFDQAMNPQVAFSDESGSYFWHTSVGTGQTFMELPLAVSPFTQLDDKRAVMRAKSDVVISYIRDNVLYCRVQRERYLTEHNLGAAPGRITAMAPNTGYRLQWRLLPNE